MAEVMVMLSTQVRRAVERLPLGPDETRTLDALEARAMDLANAAEELRSHVVLRPEPPQYSALQQEMTHFLHSLGSVQRILALLQGPEVRFQASWASQ
jgi:hypothetical protein